MSDAKIKSNTLILPKPDYVTWTDITELLHSAYQERTNQGLQYKAAYQDTHTTIERVGDGICLVALYNNELIGTSTFQVRKGVKWYHGRKYGYFSQLAVHPNFKRNGIGGLLLERKLDLCRQFDVDTAILHTSEKAKSLISWHISNGAQKVDFQSRGNNNYYSIFFRYPVNSMRINPVYCWVRFNMSKIFCKSLKNKYGHWTMFGKFLHMIMRKQLNETGLQYD